MDVLREFAQRCSLEAVATISKESTYKVLKISVFKVWETFFFFLNPNCFTANIR